MSLPSLDFHGAADIREPHYFNGRLLTAELLAGERAAGLARDRRLGMALGPGVACGMEVTLATKTPRPAVRISRGLALSADGGVVQLAETADFELVKTGSGTAAGCVFSDCQPPASPLSNAGAFLLVCGPVRRDEGSAPVSGLGNLPAPCNRRDEVEGVRFRLVAMPWSDALFPVPGSADRSNAAAFALATQGLRHRLAWRCLGLGANVLAQYLGDPLHQEVVSYGELSVTAPDCFTSAEVPLALVCWLEEGLQFVDPWAVRRRLIHPEAGPRFAPLVGDRRLAEAEAALQQFQDQLDTLAGPQAKQLEARSVFTLLPGGGFLPVAADGFNPDVFFAGFGREKVAGDPAWLRSLVRTSLDLEPLIVPQSNTGGAPVSHVRIFSFGDSPFVFFLRSTTPVAPPPPTQTPTVPEPVKEKASILVTVDLSRALDQRQSVRVTAENARGQVFPGRSVTAQGVTDYLHGVTRVTTKMTQLNYEVTEEMYYLGSTPHNSRIAVNLNGPAIPGEISVGGAGKRFVFVIDNLDPGTYAVKAAASQHRTKSSARTLSPGERLSLAFKLDPLLVFDPRIPDLVDPWPKWPLRDLIPFPVDPRGPGPLGPYGPDSGPWINPVPSRPVYFSDPVRDRAGHPYRTLVITPGVETGRKVIDIESGWTRITPGDVTPATRAQIEGALTRMATEQPGAPVTTDDWTLFIDPAHNPAAPGAEPYSYLKMGHGPALATVLVPENSALPAEHPATYAGVPEISAEVFAGRLAGGSFAGMDVLGAAWGGLRASLLDIPVANAAATGRTLLEKAATAKTDFSYIRGITADDSNAILEKKLDAAGLANASAADFAAGDPVKLEHWGRLLAQYRSLVPADTWRLDSPGLDFTPADLRLFSENNLESMGSLARALDDAALVAKLGWTEAKVAAAKENLGGKLGMAHAVLGQERALDTVLENHGDDVAPLAERLVTAGIDSVAKLADQDPAALAGEFGIDMTVAEKTVRNAIIATLKDKTGVSADVAQKVVTDTGAKRLSDLKTGAIEASPDNKVHAGRIKGGLGAIPLMRGMH